jgi:hypothetical protein
VASWQNESWRFSVIKEQQLQAGHRMALLHSPAFWTVAHAIVDSFQSRQARLPGLVDPRRANRSRRHCSIRVSCEPPGWHVHLKPDDLSKLSWGCVKQRDERLIDCKSDVDPAIDKNNAEAVAFRVFNVTPEPWSMA